MKVKEASVKFNLAEKDIVDYEAKGFIKRCGTEYTEEDFQHLGLIRSLIKIGMKESEINKYLKLLENAGTEKEQTVLLRRYRAELLNQIHEQQQALDKIDYLIYQINH